MLQQLFIVIVVLNTFYTDNMHNNKFQVHFGQTVHVRPGCVVFRAKCFLFWHFCAYRFGSVSFISVIYQNPKSNKSKLRLNPFQTITRDNYNHNLINKFVNMFRTGTELIHSPSDTINKGNSPIKT